MTGMRVLFKVSWEPGEEGADRLCLEQGEEASRRWELSK